MPDRYLTLDLSGPLFYDKVYGCWLGKNAGGTLGGPLESGFGASEPFDVWWYTDVQEGGLPNDDLEIQLIWLKALEEVGPGLTSRDLSRYWLDHVGYNYDEYGLAKTNLRLGLEPPVSGGYNNWFKDCMGCPIRSEIWACVAPGAPRLAVRYAYEDAILDHGGGESVYGELFNAAVESAAFVVDERRTLIDIGLSYIPEDCKTARAIRAAVSAHADGVEWTVARKRVLEATPHYVAQYSPINLGFQVIGLLYGEDFGDGICKTVNCGYDTDSSGASVGSYLGILAGRSGLPGRWISPLGDTIATNESWGGVRHLFDGPNPVPANLDELTERIRVVSRRVLVAGGVLGTDGAVHARLEDLYADDESRALLERSPTQISFAGPDLNVSVDYLDTPAVMAGSVKRFVTHLVNTRSVPIQASSTLVTPEGWAAPQPQRVELRAGGSASLSWDIAAADRRHVENSNRLFLVVSAADRPEQPAIPIVLVGSTACRVSGPYPRGDRSDDELLDAAFAPDLIDHEVTKADGRRGDWQETWAAGNALPLLDVFSRPGVLYVQTFLHTQVESDVRVGVEANCPARMNVNGRVLARANRYRGVRPNHGASRDGFAQTTLVRGWNEVLLKLVRDEHAPPIECHLLLSSPDRLRAGQPQIGRTRFPWDVVSGEG